MRKIILISSLCLIFLVSGCAPTTPADNATGNLDISGNDGAIILTPAPTVPVSTPNVEIDDEAARFVLDFLTALSEKRYDDYYACYSNGPISESYMEGPADLYNQGDRKRENYSQYGVGWEGRIVSLTDIEIVAEIDNEDWCHPNSPPYSDAMIEPRLFLVKCNIECSDKTCETCMTGVNYFLVYTQRYEGELGITQFRDAYVWHEYYLTEKYEPDRESANEYISNMDAIRSTDFAKGAVWAFLTALNEKDYVDYYCFYSDGPVTVVTESGNVEKTYQGLQKKRELIAALADDEITAWEENIVSITDIEIVARIDDEDWFNSPPYSDAMIEPRLFLVKCNVECSDETCETCVTGVNYFLAYTQRHDGEMGITQFRDAYFMRDYYLTEKYEPDRESANEYISNMEKRG